MISICIPIYNSNFEYLDRAVQSVLAQSSSDWILKLVDGSTEPSKKIKSWALGLNNKKIEYVINSQDKSMSGNWNYAFNLAATELVTLLHDDDMLSPNYIEEMVKLSKENPNSSAYFCNVNTIDEQEQLTLTIADYIKRFIQPKGKFIHLSGDKGLAHLLKGVFIFCPTMCYRKSKLTQQPFNKKWKMVTDLDFYINTIKTGGVLTGTSEKLYLYRRHSNNQTSKLTQSLIRFEEEVSIYTQVESDVLDSWLLTKKVANKKVIIKLHLIFLIFQSFIRFDFKQLKKLSYFLFSLFK
ncbi:MULTISPECIES: glycosyltransferase [unclassified Pseudoalteromonas]|uniref:glycosyltransferase n=1 Tax=unclassified Pseudoalteromonas TaxID=194690 RepID=UPI0005A81563|nr:MULTISPECIES: glycosyltransferase [unclassified Pseudoalteromonas]